MTVKPFNMYSGSGAAALVLLLSGGIHAGCSGGGDPDPTPSESPTPAPTATPSPTPPPASGPTEHCGIVSSDEVWRALGNPHRVTCDVQVEGAELVLEAGVIVEFSRDTALVVGQSGGASRLKMRGTAEQAVVLQGQGGAAWEGVGVFAAAEEVSLQHVSFQDARGVPGSGSFSFAPLHLHGAEVLLDHVSIDGGEECGLLVVEDARLAAESTALTLHNAEEWPVCLELDAVDSIPLEASVYSSKGADAVHIIHRSAILSRAASWGNPGVPYVPASTLELKGSVESPAILTLEAGVSLAFGSSMGLTLSSPSGREAAGLITKGTAEAPVTLTAWQETAPGAWYGVAIYGGALSEHLSLEHTRIQNAGGDSFLKTALYVAEATVTAQHLHLEDSKTLGFVLESGARFSDDSMGLVVSGCQRVGQVEADDADSIPEPEAELSGNVDDTLLVEGTTISRASTWGSLGIPYVLGSWMHINGTLDAPAILRLDPGVEIRFSNGGYWMFGKDGAAGLYAVGTVESPILFTASSGTQPGAWGALYFHDHILDQESRLEHAVIRYAGGDAFYEREGAIIVEKSAPVLSHLSIESSGCDGIGIYDASPDVDWGSIVILGEGCAD